jgi:hypothetical protein
MHFAYKVFVLKPYVFICFLISFCLALIVLQENIGP